MSLAILAAAAFVVVLSMALGDLGIFFLARAKAQTAADAAALAAAAELIPGIGRDPARFARSYADRNGATLIECRCSSDSDEVQVRVKVEVNFMVLDGPSEGFVTARGRAEVDLDRLYR
ncbi:MAG TPA: Rv3654c family TadE-like protein [Actinomycetota bacterium]|nr:Rv3654c family TadE-like protein [Actinomycetota bacterium]